MSASVQLPTWAGRVVLGDGLVAYDGPGSVADRHVHHSVQLVWSFGRPVTVELSRRSLRRTAMLVPAGEPHRVTASDDALLLVLVEPAGRQGRLLQRAANDLNGTDLAGALPTPGRSFDSDAASFATACEDLVASLVGGERRSVTAELRLEVRAAIAHINARLDGVPRLTEAAAVAGISASRLTHLFSEQVGTPFRRYVLWARLRRVAEDVQAGWDLTGAAAAAGFSDSAHLSRVFRSTFGLAPSQVLPHCEIVSPLAGT